MWEWNLTYEPLGSKSDALRSVLLQGRQKNQYDSYTLQLHSNHMIVIEI